MSEQSLLPRLSRRQFLKTSAVATALAALGDSLLGGPMATLTEGAAKEAPASDVWIPTVCVLCDEGCGLLAHQVDGVVVKVEGNPAQPANKGRICGRSNGWPLILYNPYRAKAPLKRTNTDKGLGVDPKWQEISWDEAMTTVATKVKEAMKKDPHTLYLHNGHRAARSNLMWGSFASATKTVNKLGSVNWCTGGTLHTLSFHMNGVTVADPEMEYSKYHIDVGGRFLGAKGTPFLNRQFAEAKDRGIKVVSLCPIVSPNSPNPDEWLPIKPGTDAAFHLAVANVMLNELNRYDAEFIKWRTNGPYLIGPDGLYVRAGGPKVKDPMRLNAEYGPPLVWDTDAKAARPYNDASVKNVALEGTFTVNGVTCKPSFQMLKDHVKKYTPEMAEKTTDIPAATIRRIAGELLDAAQIGKTITIDGVTLPYRPASVGFSKAYSGSRGFQTHLSARIVNLLLGNYQAPGGFASTSQPEMKPNPADGLLDVSKMTRAHEFYGEHATWPSEKADNSSAWPGVYNTNGITWYAIDDPKKYNLRHPPAVYGFTGANMLGNSTNPTFIAGVMKKIPFIFGICLQLDDVAEMCDVVLPDHSYFEKFYLEGVGDPHTYGTVDFLMQPVVPQPVFPGTRDGNEIVIDLAERCGLLFGKGGLNERLNSSYGLKDKLALDLNKRYTFEDIMDRRLKAAHGEAFGLEYFKKAGYHVLEEGGIAERFGVAMFSKARIPLYWEYMVYWREQLRKDLAGIKAKFGVDVRRPSNEAALNYMQPLPDLQPRPEFDAPAEFDLYCVHYKTMLHSMATFMDNAWINEHTLNNDPYSMRVMIHTATAAQKGIKTGDPIWVEGRFGKTKGEAMVTELTRPDTVAIAGLFGASSTNIWPPAREGPHMNYLCSGEEEYRDPITGNVMNGAKVKVYKA